jgi:hypothetical protein
MVKHPFDRLIRICQAEWQDIKDAIDCAARRQHDEDWINDPSDAHRGR